MNEMEKRIADLANVIDDPKKHLLYYRHSLADGERMEIPAITILQKGCIISATKDDSKNEIQKLFVGIPTEENYLDILYCPLCITTPMRDGNRSGTLVIHPYWIPATVDRKGTLYPPSNENDIPWLVRGVLEPNDYLNREYPVLSTVEKVDIEGSRLCINRTTWSSYLTGAEDYFKAQVGFSIHELELEDWIVETDRIALVPATIGGLTDPILNFYDYYLHTTDSRLPGALASILTPRRTKPESIDDPISAIGEAIHHGQMANRFPLSPSQRISLALLNKTKIFNTFAVNGPPGTGKTTLIQSIIADTIVKSFLVSENPPIIVGSSANNKAITNILDSFASVTPSEEYRTGLNERWLPEIEVLGHYLAANNTDKIESARDAGYWVTNPGTKDADAYRDYCEQHPVEACEPYFLSKLEAFCPNLATADLNTAFQQIRQEVVKLDTQINAITKAITCVQEFFLSYNLKSTTILILSKIVTEKISMVHNTRAQLETVLESEHLRTNKPGFFARLVDRIRFGKPEVRRARVQAALIQREDLSTLLLEENFYTLCEQLWMQRESDFKFEVNLQRAWKELNPHYLLLKPYLSGIDPSLEINFSDLIEYIQGRLDQNERHKAFWWALHGFECKWLIQRDDSEYRSLNQGESQSITRWKQRSYLTPVFVSTFHSLPNFFSYKKKTPQNNWINIPLSELVDLLVIDEAGQVTPELGVPVFGLTKKAVVVGDVQQLEPIWNIPSEPVDYSNCKRSGILKTPEAYEGFAKSYRSSVNGNLMTLAQDASSFIYPPAWIEAGSLLVEHRRCAPSIIEYCNRFVYHSLLQIKTKSKTTELPALGYCHIGGESLKRSGSQANPIEARAIAIWIKANKDSLIERYNTNLANICAVVSPFRGQEYEVINALKAEGIYEKGFVVGTVHKLQGAERPVVIFSPVYGRNHTSGKLFFNQSYNMLNVAVSRAKDHFFVFGNMALFKATETRSPANDLGRLLFQTPNAEIPNTFTRDKAELETKIHT